MFAVHNMQNNRLATTSASERNELVFIPIILFSGVIVYMHI